MKAFKVNATPSFKADYAPIKSEAHQAKKNRLKQGEEKKGRQEALYEKLIKTITLLKSNPRHPSLATHKYDGIENPFNPGEPVFEAYVENKTPTAYRLFWCYGPDEENISLLRVTPHP